jgi:hypothetical protein
MLPWPSSAHVANHGTLLAVFNDDKNISRLNLSSKYKNISLSYCVKRNPYVMVITFLVGANGPGSHQGTDRLRPLTVKVGGKQFYGGAGDIEVASGKACVQVYLPSTPVCPLF